MKRRYLKSTVLDWLDTNADLIPLVAMLGVLFAVVATCAGTADDGRGYLDAVTTPPSLVVVGTAPGSPVSLTAGSQPGATDEGVTP